MSNIHNKINTRKKLLKTGEKELNHDKVEIDKFYQEMISLKEENKQLSEEASNLILKLIRTEDRYESLKKDQTLHLEEMNSKQEEVNLFKKKVKYLEQEIAEYECHSLAEVGWTKEGLFNEFCKVSKELELVKKQLQQNTETDISQEDIGEVLIEAKMQAREIILTAENSAQQQIEETKKQQVERLEQLEKVKMDYLSSFSLVEELRTEADKIFEEMKSFLSEITFEDTQMK